MNSVEGKIRHIYFFGKCTCGEAEGLPKELQFRRNPSVAGFLSGIKVSIEPFTAVYFQLLKLFSISSYAGH